MDGFDFTFDETQRALAKRLSELETTHRQLDEEIARLHKNAADALKIQRMKRSKLALKDEIYRVKNELFPDIIA